MTTFAGTLDSRTIGLIGPTRSTGQSESAAALSALLDEVRDHFLHSLSVRQVAETALDELEAIRREAAKEGWDGHGGSPLDPNAYEKAKAFLEALPTTVSEPEIGVDSDGEVSIDWLFRHNFLVSVSVGGNGRLTFVSLRGLRSLRGTEWLDDGIPSTITQEIARVARESFA